MSGGGAVVFCCVKKKKKLFSSCKQNADAEKCFRDLEFLDDVQPIKYFEYSSA